MANRRAIKLFAVAVLTTSSAAYAGGGGGPKPVATPASEPVVQVVAKNGNIELTVKPVAVIKPRVLANYRPACGNTGGKVARPNDCTAAQLRIVEEQDRIDREASAAWSMRYAAEQKALMSTAEAIIRAEPSLKARVYINGSPACGNTMKKTSPPAFCRTAEVSKL